jgi:predicted nucleic-acid-binding protein
VLGVDTNVLVRFLAEDDPLQTPQAIQLLTDPANHPVYLAQVAIIETFWVLTKVKKFPRSKVFAAFRQLLLSDQFKVERPAEIADALDKAEEAGCDLADALIAIVNLQAGCRSTATFDVDAQRLVGMIAVGSQL